MDNEALRHFCNSLHSVTEDVKWGDDLCFCIGEKMFCVASLSGGFSVSLKVKDDEFDTLSNSAGIKPAAYVARYKWITINEADRFSKSQWEHYVRQSYDLVRSRLPKKVLDNL
jgi:predicted DNA-binding protein (MmcQ/YjbR family)